MAHPARDLNEFSNSLMAGALGAGAICIGLFMLASAEGPTNMVMRELLPMPVWGAAFIICGLVGITGQAVRSTTLIRAGHIGGCMLAAGVAACFFIAATAREISASSHGIGVYLTVSVLHLLVAVFQPAPQVTVELGAVLGALAAVLTALGGFLAVLYGRRKSQADAEGVRMQNALAPVAGLQTVVATLQQQMALLNSELTAVRDNYRQTQEALDAAVDKIGILSQENRAWSQYHADATRYQRHVADRMRSAGLADIPEPPEPPHPRTEFTRRSDFPSRQEFEQAMRRRGDSGE